MAEPVRKSYRMLPCHCPICFGKLRDVRTVRSHHSVNRERLVDNVSDVNYTDTTEEDYTAQDVVLPYTSISSTSDLDYIREENIESNIEEVDESTHYNIVVSEKRLVEFVLKEVKCKLEYGSSQAEIEKHLRNAADLLGQDLIPHKWQDVLKLLRKIGYNDPTHYKVCCERDHSCLLKGSDKACPNCGKASENCIDYYVLGLCFDTWFSTPENVISYLVIGKTKVSGSIETLLKILT